MLTVKEIIEEAVSLPIEQRAQIVDCLLDTMKKTDPEIDRKWMEIAERRLDQFLSGETEGIPAEDVFKEMDEITKENCCRAHTARA
jgi:hypothetical protein